MRPVPGIQLEQQPPKILMRMALYGEARGERDAERDLDAAGMLCVCMVIRNREARAGSSVGREILRPRAFSCFNLADPNREKLLTAWRDDPVSWERADAVADLAERGMCVDPTNGASHYCIVSLWGTDDTGRSFRWFSKQEIEAGRTTETARFGHHVFARAR